MVNDGTELRAGEKKVKYSAPPIDIRSPGISAQHQSVTIKPEASQLVGRTKIDRADFANTTDVLPSGSPPRDVSSLFSIEEPDDVAGRGNAEPPFV